MVKELPARKPTRSKNIDYSKAGAYFVTICTQDRKHLLLKIEYNGNSKALFYLENRTGGTSFHDEVASTSEEAGAASYSPTLSDSITSNNQILHLSSIGKIAEEQLLALEERFPDIHIDEYIFMPNHIHASIFINENRTALSSSEKINRYYACI